MPEENTVDFATLCEELSARVESLEAQLAEEQGEGSSTKVLKFESSKVLKFFLASHSAVVGLWEDGECLCDHTVGARESLKRRQPLACRVCPTAWLSHCGAAFFTRLWSVKNGRSGGI
jgi:hypothetical protein